MRTKRGRYNRGFTLIELMIAITIVALLAMVAIPSVTSYVARSKSSEAVGNLSQLFKSAASYYVSEVGGKGIASVVSGNCTVDDSAPEPATPRGEKQPFVSRGEPSLEALGIRISDFVYFSYGIRGVGTGCGHVANESLYTFFANGDLDEDGVMSTFELQVGADENNLLRHGRGFYIVQEGE